MRRTTPFAVAVVAGAMLLALGVPAGADGTGTVTGSVTMEFLGPCLTLSPTSLDFGQGQFGQLVYGTVTLSSCSDAEESIAAHGTDASGSSGATWTLAQPTGSPPDSPCNEGTDTYFQFIQGDAGRGYMTLNDQTIVQFEGQGGTFRSVDAQAGAILACAGSSGGGTQMSMSWLFTAIV